MICATVLMGQTYPPVSINTTIAPWDHWYYAGTNIYYNAFNLGGTTGTNGYFIWNGIRYDNPFFSIVDGTNDPITGILGIRFYTPTNSLISVEAIKSNNYANLYIDDQLVRDEFSLSWNCIENISNHLDKLQLDFTFLSNNVASKTLFTGPGTTGLITSITSDLTKFLRGDGAWVDVATPSNIWVKGDMVTNAIPRDDSVISSSIAAGAVESDEIASGAVTVGKLSTNIFLSDLQSSNNTIRVIGLQGKSLPNLVGHVGHVLALDENTNWVFNATSTGDMLAENYATNTRTGYWVDRAVLAATSTNTTGLLGYPAVTNGRVDESVVTYDADTGRYLHRDLSSLGAGDMLRATYAVNSLTNLLHSDWVDSAFFASNAAIAKLSTNTLAILGTLIVTNGRVDESVLTYDLSTGTYLHRDLSALGAGDMLKSVYDINNNNKVDQIDDNVITSNNVVNGSLLGEDLANGTITPIKTTGLLNTNTSFTGGDMDGTYNTLTVQKLKSHDLKFGETTDNYILGFDSAGAITSRFFSANLLANKTPKVLNITNGQIFISITDAYVKVNADVVETPITNWVVQMPVALDGTLWKLDLYYVTNVPFSWAGDLVVNLENTNVLSTPPPIGYSSYIFEIIQGSTNIIAY